MTAKKKTAPAVEPEAQAEEAKAPQVQPEEAKAEPQAQPERKFTPIKGGLKTSRGTSSATEERISRIEDIVNRLGESVSDHIQHVAEIIQEISDRNGKMDDALAQLTDKDLAISAQLKDLGVSLNRALKRDKAWTDDMNERVSAIEDREQITRKSLGESLARVNTRIQSVENPKAVTIEIKKLDESKPLAIPTPSKDGSIGDDLETVEDIWVNHGRNIIPLNFCINLPRGIEGKIEPRSGFSARGIYGACVKYVSEKLFGILRKPAVEVEVKENMDADVINGKIDPGYRNGVGVIIKNHTVPFMIPAGTRLAQITYYRTVAHRYKKVDEFSDGAPYVSDRKGGFGSSNGEEKDND